jgi:hypothetical protein
MRESVKQEIRYMNGLDYKKFQTASPDWRIPKNGYYPTYFMHLQGIITDISERLQKLEELTKANDYEYKTETKLIKIKKEFKCKK